MAHFPGETLFKAAAPVRDPHGELAGLLGVSYPAADVAATTSERRTRRLIEAAEELSNTGDDAC